MFASVASWSLNHCSESHPLHPAQQITRLFYIKTREPIIISNPISSFVIRRKEREKHVLKCLSLFTQIYTVVYHITNVTHRVDSKITELLDLWSVPQCHSEPPFCYPRSLLPAHPPLCVLSFCLCSRSHRICNFKAFLAVF